MEPHWRLPSLDAPGLEMLVRLLELDSFTRLSSTPHFLKRQLQSLSVAKHAYEVVEILALSGLLISYVCL